MRKICIVIGSREHSNTLLAELPGSESDANQIYTAFLDPSLGEYDVDHSRLLISPMYSDVTNTLDAIIANNPNIDVFTFAFSGHAGVKNGNLFLCLKDTVPDRLSTTALSLSYLFVVLNEAAPSQTNIIIDACQSGGVIFNLNQLVNPEFLGAENSPGVSILASAASDQTAKETTEGGCASIAFIHCLKGVHRIQTKRPYLNLVEVGNFVSKIVSGSPNNQTPVVWGLNLFGESFLAKNPHFEGDTLPYSYSLAHIPAASRAGQILQEESRSLWQVYERLPEQLDVRLLLSAIRQPSERLGAEDGVVSSFVRGLSQTIPHRASEQKDLFARVQALSCCLISLLPLLESDSEAEGTILELSKQLSADLQSTLEGTYHNFRSDRFAILSNRGGAADLFVVPLRISKVIGWAGANVFLSNMCDFDTENSVVLLDKIVRFIVDEYLGSVVSISDIQSPYVLCGLSQLIRHDLVSDAEIILGSMFGDYIENKGFIASADIAPNKVPEFLLRRYSGNTAGARKIYAQPDELLTVLLYLAHELVLDDVIDPYLERIDHHLFNVFLPEDYTQFAEGSIRNGVNATFQIGDEGRLGVFRTSDFRYCWDTVCAPLLQRQKRIRVKPLNILVLLTALLLPDRVPWLALSHRTQLFEG